MYTALLEKFKIIVLVFLSFSAILNKMDFAFIDIFQAPVFVFLRE